MLVEHSVVGEEVLAVDGLDASVCAHSTSVCEVAVEPWRSDEGDHTRRGRRDLLHRQACRSYEPRPEQQVLWGISRHRELREHDEIGADPLRAIELAEDSLAVAIDVADDDVLLYQRDPQGFRLTVTNRV